MILSDFTPGHLVGTRRASVKSSFRLADSRIAPETFDFSRISTPEEFSRWPQFQCGRTANLTTKHHGSAPLLDEEKGKEKIKNENGKPEKQAMRASPLRIFRVFKRGFHVPHRKSKPHAAAFAYLQPH